MKTVLITAAGIAVAIAGAVVWLQAAAPTIGATNVTPSVIGVTTPTLVTITAKITDLSLLPAGVNLLRVDASGKTPAIIGVMHDDGLSGDAVGGDKIFSLRLTANEPTVGQTNYQVSAAFKGVLKRTLSNLIVVNVLTPEITWSENSVEVILSPGESTSKDLTFTSNVALQNIIVESVPPIAAFVSVQPNDFAIVPAGQLQSVHLTFSIPANATLGAYDGTVHVRLGSQTLPQTLEVSVLAWKNFADPTLGISFKFPLNLAASTRGARRGTEVILVDASPASADLAVVLAFQAFPVASGNPTVLDVVHQRLSPDAILSIQAIYGGALVEADDLHHFHYFQYSATTQRGLEVYGAADSFFTSREFVSFLSSLRF